MQRLGTDPAAKAFAQRFVDFVNVATCPYTAVEQCARKLLEKGFLKLSEKQVCKKALHPSTSGDAFVYDLCICFRAHTFVAAKADPLNSRSPGTTLSSLEAATFTPGTDRPWWRSVWVPKCAHSVEVSRYTCMLGGVICIGNIRECFGSAFCWESNETT